MSEPRTQCDCLGCGSVFDTPTRYLKRGRGHYCSVACGQRAAQRKKWENYNARLPNEFWSRVDRSAGADNCWPWVGRKAPSGYGRLVVSGIHVGAHRMALTLSGVNLPEGMFACHHCDNPPCCNPKHLFVGTHADNMADMDAKGRRHKGPRPSTLRARQVKP